MSESTYFENILAYLTENKLKTTFEAKVKFMAIKAKKEKSHAKGPGVNFKPKPPDEAISFEKKDWRLDAIYDEEPSGLKKI